MTDERVRSIVLSALLLVCALGCQRGDRDQRGSTGSVMSGESGERAGQGESERAASAELRQREAAEAASRAAEESAQRKAAIEQTQTERHKACCLSLARRGFEERSEADMAAKAVCEQGLEQGRSLEQLDADLQSALGQRPRPAACPSRPPSAP